MSLLHNLTPEQLSLALQVIWESENKQEILVPQELQNLSAEDWMRLDLLWAALLLEKKASSLH